MARQGFPVCEWQPSKSLQVELADLVSLKAHSLDVKPTRVLLVADAQLRNPSGISALNSWFGYDHYTAYLRKSWRVVSRLHPNAVMFLGDTFASSRYVTSETECVFRPVDVSIGHWAVLTHDK